MATDHSVVWINHLMYLLLINLSYHSFIYSFSRYFWNTYYVLGTVLGIKDTVVSETDKVPYSSGTYPLVVEADN